MANARRPHRWHVVLAVIAVAATGCRGDTQGDDRASARKRDETTTTTSTTAAAPAPGESESPAGAPADRPTTAAGPEAVAGSERSTDVQAAQRSERLTRVQARAWWALRPYLVADGELKFGRPDVLFLAKTDEGHDKTDPRRTPASLSAVHVPAGTTVEPGTWTWMDDGGILLGVTSYPPSVPAAYRPTMTPDRMSEAVQVRGQHGLISEYRNADGASREITTLRWNTESEDGVFLSWSIAASPKHYKKAELVAWADALRETAGP